MRSKVSTRWLIVVLVLVLVAVLAQACAPPGYNPGATASQDTIRQQVRVLSFEEATCYVYINYGISCVDAKR